MKETDHGLNFTIGGILLMQIQLDQLISQTLEELKKLGMKKSTIKSYRYSAYSPIRNYCVQQRTTRYEPATLDAIFVLPEKTS